MTRDEIRTLLALAAACESRGWAPNATDVDAWTAILNDVDDLAQAKAAVVAHYRTSRHRVTPSEVRDTLRAARADRLARQVELPPDADPDDVPGYLAALRAGRVRQAGPVARRDMTAIEQTFPAVPAATVAVWQQTRDQLARRPAAPVEHLTFRQRMARLNERFGHTGPPAIAAAPQPLPEPAVDEPAASS